MFVQSKPIRDMKFSILSFIFAAVSVHATVEARPEVCKKKYWEEGNDEVESK